MSVVAAMVESREAATYLRRSLPRSGPRVVSCRSIAGLQRQFATRVIEVVVLSPRHHLWEGARALIEGAYPGIHVMMYGAYRVDDGDLLLRCQRAGIAAAAVLGVDDPVVGDMALRVSLSARRRAALAHAPRMLNLTEPLQLEVWHTVLAEADRPLRTEGLARRLGMTREHLSRQFAAGGAPNLKRVLDLARVVCAAQLLPNPGYTQADVAGLLQFSSASHLSRTAQRVAGVGSRQLPDLSPAELLTRFARGKTRSRL
jgi:transcriptional regulator GlxA family with amidase domain